MRVLIDSMIAVMLAGLIVGMMAYRHTSQRQQRHEQTVRASLSQMREQVSFHGAIEQGEQDEAVHPPQIQPRWFINGVPGNPLTSKDQPWMDIAPANDFADQPPDPIVTRPGQAAFWYNPNLGVVRARVPQRVSERLTLELYNQVNEISLSALPYDRDADRVPLAFNPSPVTAGQHATPAPQTVRQVSAQPPTRDQPQGIEPSQEPSTSQDAETPWWDRSANLPPLDAQPAGDLSPDDTDSRPSLLSP